MYVYTCMYIHVCIYMYVYTCIYSLPTGPSPCATRMLFSNVMLKCYVQMPKFSTHVMVRCYVQAGYYEYDCYY